MLSDSKVEFKKHIPIATLYLSNDLVEYSTSHITKNGGSNYDSSYVFRDSFD